MQTPFLNDVRDLLASDVSPRDFVLELVKRLDLRIAALRVAGEGAPLETEALVRSFIAAGCLLEPMPTVARTPHAAREYVDDPTEDRYAALYEAGTNSFPFGPGVGCQAVPAIGYTGCEPGSGCLSRAGTLASIAEMVGYDAVAGAIKKELTDWLRGQPRGG
jgi:hypothetical protein